jgi:adenylate kinase
VRDQNIPHVSSGDMFRAIRDSDTELGRLIKSYMDSGALVPDDVTIRMVMDRLAQEDAAGGVLLDGFPRTLEQARALDAAFTQQGKNIDRVLYIKVSTDELLNRLGGRWICRVCGKAYHTVFAPPRVAGVCDDDGGELYQRADDNMETAKTRLDVYFNQTAPLIDYYTDQKKLIEVNGEQTMERVEQAVLGALHA